MISLLEKAEKNRELGKNMNFTYHFPSATKKIKVRVFCCLRLLHVFNLFISSI